MNSIFIRIYGGMLLSLLVVGLLSYIFVERGNAIRTEAYREAVAQGTFHLIANGAARYRAESRTEWIAKVEGWIGERMYVEPIVDVDLNTDSIEAMQSGRVLVRTGDDGLLHLYVKIPTEEHLLIHMKLREFSAQQARGTIRLVIEELSHYPESTWDIELERIQHYFGFDIQKKPAVNLDLDEVQIERLGRGEVVMTFVRESTTPVSKIQVLAQLPQGDYIVLGPLELESWFSYHVMFVIGAIALATLGLASYMLVRPLQNRLKRMDAAVAKIRRGDLTGRLVVDNNDALGQLAGTFNDLVEHIQRLIDSQREMTRAVSHELRTPVARIRFGLEIVADLDDTAQRHKYIKDIDSDIEELDKLIDEILTYASLEEGTPSVNFEMVDIEELLETIKRETEALGTKIEIEHIPSSEEGDRRLAECEERLIHRAVQNLVTNAIRYADSKVLVSSAFEGDMYRVDVEDDGPGIPQDKWEKVFVPFARLDDSRTRASGGYGLGLSIVRRIAFWHGGVASVYRSRLGGAKFTVIWPRKQDPTGFTPATSESSEQEDGSRQAQAGV